MQLLDYCERGKKINVHLFDKCELIPHKKDLLHGFVCL